jgi:hypothetical protein
MATITTLAPSDPFEKTKRAFSEIAEAVAHRAVKIARREGDAEAPRIERLSAWLGGPRGERVAARFRKWSAFERSDEWHRLLIHLQETMLWNEIERDIARHCFATPIESVALTNFIWTILGAARLVLQPEEAPLRVRAVRGAVWNASEAPAGVAAATLEANNSIAYDNGRLPDGWRAAYDALGGVPEDARSAAALVLDFKIAQSDFALGAAAPSGALRPADLSEAAGKRRKTAPPGVGGAPLLSDEGEGDPGGEPKDGEAARAKPHAGIVRQEIAARVWAHTHVGVVIEDAQRKLLQAAPEKPALLSQHDDAFRPDAAHFELLRRYVALPYERWCATQVHREGEDAKYAALRRKAVVATVAGPQHAYREHSVKLIAREAFRATARALLGQAIDSFERAGLAGGAAPSFFEAMGRRAPLLDGLEADALGVGNVFVLVVVKTHSHADARAAGVEGAAPVHPRWQAWLPASAPRDDGAPVRQWATSCAWPAPMGPGAQEQYAFLPPCALRTSGDGATRALEAGDCVDLPLLHVEGVPRARAPSEWLVRQTVPSQVVSALPDDALRIVQARFEASAREASARALSLTPDEFAATPRLAMLLDGAVGEKAPMNGEKADMQPVLAAASLGALQGSLRGPIVDDPLCAAPHELRRAALGAPRGVALDGGEGTLRLRAHGLRLAPPPAVEARAALATVLDGRSSELEAQLTHEWRAGDTHGFAMFVRVNSAGAEVDRFGCADGRSPDFQWDSFLDEDDNDGASGGADLAALLRREVPGRPPVRVRVTVMDASQQPLERRDKELPAYGPFPAPPGRAEPVGTPAAAQEGPVVDASGDAHYVPTGLAPPFATSAVRRPPAAEAPPEGASALSGECQAVAAAAATDSGVAMVVSVASPNADVSLGADATGGRSLNAGAALVDADPQTQSAAALVCQQARDAGALEFARTCTLARATLHAAAGEEAFEERERREAESGMNVLGGVAANGMPTLEAKPFELAGPEAAAFEEARAGRAGRAEERQRASALLAAAQNAVGFTPDVARRAQLLAPLEPLRPPPVAPRESAQVLKELGEVEESAATLTVGGTGAEFLDADLLQLYEASRLLSRCVSLQSELAVAHPLVLSESVGGRLLSAEAERVRLGVSISVPPLTFTRLEHAVLAKLRELQAAPDALSLHMMARPLQLVRASALRAAGIDATGVDEAGNETPWPPPGATLAAGRAALLPDSGGVAFGNDRRRLSGTASAAAGGAAATTYVLTDALPAATATLRAPLHADLLCRGRLEALRQAFGARAELLALAERRAELEDRVEAVRAMMRRIAERTQAFVQTAHGVRVTYKEGPSGIPLPLDAESQDQYADALRSGVGLGDGPWKAKPQ